MFRSIRCYMWWSFASLKTVQLSFPSPWNFITMLTGFFSKQRNSQVIAKLQQNIRFVLTVSLDHLPGIASSKCSTAKGSFRCCALVQVDDINFFQTRPASPFRLWGCWYSVSSEGNGTFLLSSPPLATLWLFFPPLANTRLHIVVFFSFRHCGTLHLHVRALIGIDLLKCRSVYYVGVQTLKRWFSTHRETQTHTHRNGRRTWFL